MSNIWKWINIHLLMLGLSIIKLLLMILIQSMEIYKWSCGRRNILNVDLLCVINFYYYFHMPKFWEFYYPFDFHKPLQIIKKLLLRSEYIFHSFFKIHFFPFFPFLLLYACFAHMTFITVTWQLVKINTAREEKKRTHKFFLSDSHFLCEFFMLVSLSVEQE